MQKSTERETYARFGTLLGAVVTLTRITDTRTQDKVAFTWTCNGCRDHIPFSDASVVKVRDEANQHAGTCRSLPPR
jgi:hypothetical protein